MNTTGFSIRSIAPDDYGAVFDVARSLASWFRPIDQMAFAIDVTRHEGFVAGRGAKLLGFVTFHEVGDDVAELSWLGVRPEAQGQGIGGALLTALEDELRRRGVERVQVGTVAEDVDEPAFAATRQFYTAHGFRPVGHDRDFYGRGRHRVLLEKQL